MKQKGTKGLSIFFTARAFLAFLLFVMIICSLSFAVSATQTEQNYNVENYNLTDKHYMLLGEEINRYHELDTSQEKLVSKSVTTVINAYRKELTDLQTHEDVSKRLLTNEVALAYSKGLASGRLAWIYHYNLLEIKNSAALSRIAARYEEYYSEIHDSTDAEVLDARADAICTEFNRAIYQEKLNLLMREEDSSEASGIIELALRKIPDIESSDLFGENFSAIYSETVSLLHLQRSRDFLLAQIKALFPIIREGEDIQANQTIRYFSYILKDAEAVSKMNEEFKNALAELTEQSEADVYSTLFISTLNEKIATSVAQASHENVCADVFSLFESYPLEYKRAQSKDAIARILDCGDNTALKAIEGEFNGDGGLVDGCSSSAALELEIIRARYRKNLFDSMNQTLERLQIILGSYDKSAFEERISILYTATDKALKELTSPKETFEAQCSKALTETDASFSSLLNEAKAERFLLDHKSIIKKPKEELLISDELFLKSALNDFTMLEQDVQETLKSQISAIAEKYNIVINKKILSLAPNDTFYLDLCEPICTELKNLSAESIDVFYNNCNLVLSKAQTLCSVIAYYRDMLSAQAYTSYNESEKSELASVCESIAKRISDAELSDDELAQTLEMLLDSAKISMNRINECVRLRVAARESNNIEIKALIAQARAKIASSTDKSEMISIADNAIFKINRELTKDEINVRSDKYAYLIKEMKFLASEKKSSLTSKIRALKATAYNDAALAENITVLSFIWNNFSESIEELLSEGNAEDLTQAKTSYLSLFEDESEKFTLRINGLSYLSSTRRDEILNSSVAIAAKLKSDVVACANSQAVALTYTQTLEELQALALIASNENLNNYKAILNSELLKFKEAKSNYSVENYSLLESTIDKNTKTISAAASLSEAQSLFQKALGEIESISTLLDDAKLNALRQLDNALNACRTSSALYSPQSMSSIENFYKDAINKINSYESISDVSSVNDALNTALSLINSVRKDMVFTSASAEAISNPNAQYPASYDFSSGYWGCLISSNGIASNAIFSISNATPGNSADIQAIIRKAAKNNELSVYGSISDEKLKLLKKCVVSMELELNLSQSADAVSAYTVRMLLPSHMAEENVLGIVFIDENNNVEFYNAESSNSLISFNLSHFSRYYIVSENTTDLLPLIIFLSVILVLEILVLALVALLHFYRKRKEKNNMFPLLSAFSINPFFIMSALRVTPQNGVGLTVFLSVAVIALGCGIAMLAKLELKALHGQNRRSAARPETRSETPMLSEKRRLLKEKQEIPVLCAVGTSTELDAPSLEEELYKCLAEEQEMYEGDYRRKTEINIDVIAEQFEAGDLVNLELLKKKRLVSKRTDFVKILARGTLTKPLVIEAQDFSRAAEEMLKAVGGEAIRVK